MRLHDVARYFDDEPIYDGYDPSIFLFKGQLGDFNDATSVGATLRRRTLSIDPQYALPARQVVLIEPLVWIAGLPITETFQGKDIRKTYNLRLATNFFEVGPPGIFLDQAGGSFTVYGYSEYFKSNINVKEDSEYDTFWNIFFALGEGIAPGFLLWEGARCLRVRQAYQTPDQMFIAQCDELDSDWSQDATFNGLGTYDPIADTDSNDDITVPAIMMDVSIFFRWIVQGQADQKPGDKTMLVSMTGVTPKVGASVQSMGRAWKILAVQPEQDAWALHIRPL